MKTLNDAAQRELVDYLQFVVDTTEKDSDINTGAILLLKKVDRQRRKKVFRRSSRESHESVVEDAYREHTGEI